MEKSFNYFNLIEIFPTSGCAICNLLVRDVSQMLDSVLYEYVTDPEMQGKFRASRGLCNEHGWQLTRLGNVLGIAILYEGALDEVLKILDQTELHGNGQHGLARLLFPQNPGAALCAALEPSYPCIACKMESASEERYLSVLCEHIMDAPMQEVYRASEGLCLEHFKRALHHTLDTERSRLFVEIQLDIWKRLRHELLEFIRKNNFQFADEPMGAEGNSWLRTVARLGGERGVSGVRPAAL